MPRKARELIRDLEKLRGRLQGGLVVGYELLFFSMKRWFFSWTDITATPDNRHCNPRQAAERLALEVRPGNFSTLREIVIASPRSAGHPAQDRGM